MRGRTILAGVAVVAVALVSAGGSRPAGATSPAYSFQQRQFALSDNFATARSIAVGDLDGRHGNDVVVAGFGGDLDIFLNNGLGGFKPVEHIPGSCFSGDIAGVAIGHFSSSGHPDILVACSDALNDGFVRYEGNGDGTFKPVERAAPIQGYSGEDENRHPVYVGNTISSLAHGQFGGEKSIVWNECQAGNGCGYFLCALPDRYFATDFGSTECSIEVNGNGQVDGFTEVYSPLVLGKFAAATPSDWAFTNAPPDAGLYSGSLIGAVHTGTQPPDYIGGFSSDNFEPPAAVPGGNVRPLAAGDLNGDGNSEVISGYAGDNEDQLAVYQLTGTDSSGTILIPQPQLYATNPAMSAYDGGVVGDFNHDGKLDVVVLGASFAADCCEQLQVFPGNGTGSLGAPQEFNVADFTTEAPLASGDLNGDGLPDVVTTIENGLDEHMVVFYNTSVPIPPNTQITKSTISSTHHRATFAFKAIGIATGFQCALKAGGAATFKSCHSPKQYLSVHKGHYVFEVRAVHGSLVDPTPAKKAFTITK